MALLLIGCTIAYAACSLITDVERSKIEGAGGSAETGGSSSIDSGTNTGGLASTGGTTSSDDAGNASDAD